MHKVRASAISDERTVTLFALLYAVPCTLSAVFLLGCSEIQTPTVSEAMTHPFGTQAPFSRGTPKSKVLAEWGTPDHVIVHGKDELGNPKEEWIYTGRLQGVPVDVGYVSKTKHLFFEGNSLVRWETEQVQEAPPPEQ